jgi:hypothetical protein
MNEGLKLSTKADSKLTNESICRKVVGIMIYLTATKLDLSFVFDYKYKLHDTS